MSEEKKSSASSGKTDPKFLFLILAAAVVIVMMIVQYAGRKNSSQDTCNVVPQSPWGQSQSQVWTEVKSVPEGKAIAGFDFAYPDAPDGYAHSQLRVYTKQAFEVIYTNDAGEEGMRVDKANVCGKDVYDALYTDQNAYDHQNTVEINGMKVKEKGNGDTISTLQWEKGDYSYGIACWNHPVSREEAEELVSQVK